MECTKIKAELVGYGVASTRHGKSTGMIDISKHGWKSKTILMILQTMDGKKTSGGNFY